MTRKEQLKADLLKNFSDFQKIKEPGGSAAANEIVASGLADSIDRAIDDGVEFSFQGVFAVKDINAIQEKAPGYLYTCSDSGILKAKTELPVVKNTVVLWNGEDFKTFLVIPEATGSSVQISVDSFLSTLSGNPVQNKVVTTAINALSEAIAAEAAARSNADTALGSRIDGIATDIASAVSQHNLSGDAHADIRQALGGVLDDAISWSAFDAENDRITIKTLRSAG